MKKLFLVTMVSLGFVVIAQAQYYYDRSKNPDKVPSQPKRQNRSQSSNSGDYSKFFFASWDGNNPMSNSSFINNFSSLGTRFGFRKRINDVDNIWIGGDFGEAVYHQHFPYQTYATSSTQSVSTDLYNYSYNYGVTVNIDYFFFPMEKIINPYVGIGIGAAYDKFAEYYNINSSAGDSWGLLIRPEAGILVGFKQNSPWRVKAAVHYDYASNTNSSFGYKNFINTGLQIGIVKMIR